MLNGKCPMDRQSKNLTSPQDTLAATVSAVRPAAPRRSFASRLFGYDIFLSFALGPPPRGTHSYASDLARRLRERDYTVFFSEDEAPPGEHLDSTLTSALHRSKSLVVIVNRATLERPGWIQQEVEEFKRRHPGRPIIPISIEGALQDLQLANNAQQWLGHQDKIWLDESEMSITNGIASEALVERLVTAPAHAKSNVSWRLVVRGVVVILAVLAIGLGVATKQANDSANRARAELRKSVAIRLIVEAQGMFSHTRNGNDERGLLQLLAAYRINPGYETESGLLNGLLQFQSTSKIIETYARIQDVAFSPDGSYIISDHGDPNMWDVNTGQPVDMPKVSQKLNSAYRAKSPDGSRIVTDYDNYSLQIKDTNTNQPMGLPLQGHLSEITSVAYAPDGKLIVSGSVDNTLRLWDAKTGRAIGKPLSDHTDDVTSVAFSPDGKLIVSGSDDTTLRLWDARTGNAIGAPLQGHSDKVTSVAFSPDGKLIVSGSDDSTLRLWNVYPSQNLGHTTKIAPTGQPSKENEQSRLNLNDKYLWQKFKGRYDFIPKVVKKIDVREIQVTCMDVSRDGSRIIVGGDDNNLRLWDVKTGQQIGQPINAHMRKITSVAFSPDGSRIVSASHDKTLRLWNTNTGQPIGQPLQGHTGFVSFVAFSPDGQRIVSVSKFINYRTPAWVKRLSGSNNSDDQSIDSDKNDDNTLHLWNGTTGEPIGEPLRGHTDSITLVTFSPDSRRIVSVSDDKTLRLWNGTTGKSIGEPLQENIAPVFTIAISPDGNSIVTGRGDAKLQFWDANTGKHIGEPLEGHDQPVTKIIFSPDGNRIISASDDQTLRIWDTKTRRTAGILQGTSDEGINNLAFSHDGNRIVSSSDKGTLHLWDTNTRQPISPTLHTGHVTFLGFTSDDLNIITFDKISMTLGLWPAPNIWPEELCKKLSHNMSRKEWRVLVSPEIDYIAQCPGLPITPDETEMPRIRRTYTYIDEEPATVRK
jgi:WD40 repeat protein